MIEGDARDVGALIRALDGCDAVVSSLGTGVGLLAVVTQLLPFIGYPRALNATACLNEVLPETKGA